MGGIVLIALLVALIRPALVRSLLSNVTGVEIGLTGIRLQLAVDAAARAIEAKESQEPDREKLAEDLAEVPAAKRVLWVDDDPAGNRDELTALRELGLHVDSALTNDEAVRAVHESSYDLVITDVARAAPRMGQVDSDSQVCSPGPAVLSHRSSITSGG